MIIECQTCHARFRLDESRIKGRGARVKCRKCGDGIVVLKDGPPPAAAPPGEEGSFDLGSAVRDTGGERPAPPPPAGNLIPFPAPPRTPEPIVSETSLPAPGPVEPGQDEVDLAFDRLLSAGREGSSPSVGKPTEEFPFPPQEGEPAEEVAPSAPEPPREPDLGGLTLDFGPEEKLDLPLPAPEPAFQEPPPAPPSADSGGESGFLISDSDTLDFLQGKGRGAAPVAPPEVGDISMEISAAPADEAISFLRVPEATPAPPVDSDTSAMEEIPLEGNVTPLPSAPDVDVPPYREEEPPPSSPAEPAERREFPERETAPEKRSPRTPVAARSALAAVAAVLLVAGGYFGLTTSGRKTLERAVPWSGALWGGKPAAPTGPKFDLRNVIGYFESGTASPRILVIKGQVANLSQAEKSGIRIHAALLDNADAVLVQQTVYAGNMLSGDAIRNGSRDSVSKTLENRFGEGLANMNVAAGKAIPFMVVFFDAPANMDSYKLEAKDGE